MNDKLVAELIKSTKPEDLSEKCAEISELIGLENVVKLSKYMLTDSLYLPKVDRILQTARNKKIAQEYTGYNMRELSKKYGISRNQIDRILKKEKQK